MRKTKITTSDCLIHIVLQSTKRKLAKITIFRARAEIVTSTIQNVFDVDMKFKTLRISLELTWTGDVSLQSLTWFP